MNYRVIDIIDSDITDDQLKKMINKKMDEIIKFMEFDDIH